MIRWCKKALNTFAFSEDGVALIEFGYCIGLLMLLLWGGVEVSRYVLIMQKLQDAVAQETNIIGTTNLKTTTVTATELQDTLKAVSVMMNPYSFTFNDNNVVMVTDLIEQSNGKAKVMWRYCNPSIGNSNSLSKFGPISSTIDLGIIYPGFSLAADDEVIVTEVYYQFSPIIQNAIITTLLPVKKPVYAESLGVPRFGSLAGMVGSSTFPPNCP